MAVLFANNATATLASGITNSALGLALTSGQGALFPSPAGSDYFYATLVDVSNNIEIVKCTARSGDNLTIVRAQQNTIARAYSAGDKCELRLTAASLNEMQGVTNGSVDTAKLADGAVTSIKIVDDAVTTAKIASGAVTAAELASGAAIGNIGFTPVKQGGTAEVKLTWVEPYIYAFVNNVAQGNFLFEELAADVASAGYRGIPTILRTTTTTLDPAYCGKMLVYTSAGVTNWVPSFAAVGLQEGYRVTIANVSGGPITIGQGADVGLVQTSTGLVGSRTLANFGFVHLTRITGNTWFIVGDGLS